MFNINTSTRKRGVSLIEGVLYLVIALAVIVGGIVYFQQAQLSNQVADTARASVAISSQTRGLYQNQRTFGTGDITAALLSSGAVPSNFEGPNNDIVHPFGGTISVFGNVGGFALAFEGMSEAACTRLFTVGDGGDGPLGTGIEAIMFLEDEGVPASMFDGDISDEQIYVPAPVTADVAQQFCGEAAALVVSYRR